MSHTSQPDRPTWIYTCNFARLPPPPVPDPISLLVRPKMPPSPHASNSPTPCAGLPRLAEIHPVLAWFQHMPVRCMHTGLVTSEAAMKVLYGTQEPAQGICAGSLWGLCCPRHKRFPSTHEKAECSPEFPRLCCIFNVYPMRKGNV